MNIKYIKICELFNFEKGKESSPKDFELDNINGVNCAIAKNNNSGFVGKKINPIKIDGSIDFEFMENYIKSLPYSKYL